MRFVFLHNHIFKNAGSTVDRIFENAGFRHTPLEAGGSVYPAMVVETVLGDSGIEYISSHVFRAPRPEDLEGIGFVDITFLRHPIDRLYSIYRYSRQPGVSDFPFAGKDVAFADFVHALAGMAPEHMHSPQTTCLGNRRDFYFPPGPTHLERAKAVVSDTRFLGVVDLFQESFRVFSYCCKQLMPGKDLRAMEGPFESANKSPGGAASLDERLEEIRAELGAESWGFVERCNAIDMALYRFGREEVLRRHGLIAARGLPR